MTERDVIIRLIMAVALGGFIGLERERLHVGYKTYSAGFRTHILVCVGAAICMIVSVAMHDQFKGDAARIAAQVVSGIGFLGAGAIMREGLLVRGLTTAASLWVVAAVGLACGGGYFLAATLGTLLVLFALVILGTIEDFVRGKRKYDMLSIVLSDAPEQVGRITALLEKQIGNVKRIEINKTGEPGRMLLEVYMKLPAGANLLEIMHSIAAEPGVYRVDHRA